jgi:hypothetical protein
MASVTSKSTRTRTSSVSLNRSRSRRPATPLQAPSGALKRLEAAASRDLGVARLTIGLFEAILGRARPILFPGSRGSLLDFRRFPKHLRKDTKILIDWAIGSAPVRINAVYYCADRIEEGVRLMRSHSVLGRRLRRRAKRIMLRNPPLPKEKWRSAGVTFPLMREEIGKPLNEGMILKAAALQPKVVQIVPHDAFMNGTWTPGTLTVRLDPDGYTVAGITLTFEKADQAIASDQRRFEGDLIDFFETGTEGVIWMLEDESRYGYAALQPICDGDHLTVSDQLGKILWRGLICCDKVTGRRSFAMNPKYGQQCALGHWVHWIQKGFEPDAWAKFFIRPEYDRLRGILVLKHNSKRDARLGPETFET